MCGALNEGLGKLVENFRRDMGELLSQFSGCWPLPEYKPGEEQAFVTLMKPLHKNITTLIGSIEEKLSDVQDTSGELGIESTTFLPDFIDIKKQVKEALTVCGTNLACKILVSKAYANSSGNLLGSVEASLQFIQTNGLDLDKGLVDRLTQCQAKLASAAASKQKTAAEAK